MQTDWNGYPPDPQTSGWHMLRQGCETAAYWNAAEQCWEQGGICCGGRCSPEFLISRHFIDGVQYIGPLVVVPERDRLLAVVEAAQKLLDAEHSHGEAMRGDPSSNGYWAQANREWAAYERAETQLRAALAALKDTPNAR